MLRKPTVQIPRSELRVQLDEAAGIKRQMAELLRQLESHATGKPVAKPGGWRHDPIGWSRQLRDE